MEVSSDLTVRTTGMHYYQPPSKKDDVTDDAFIRIMSNLFGHTRFLSIAQCHALSSPAINSILCRATSLTYLDLSYTAIDDLQPLTEACWSLRALSLAGARAIADFGPLAALTTLELLNLRATNLMETQPLAALVCLRSLDLGFTEIAGLEAIARFTRLEELQLDGCRYLEDDLTPLVATLPSLRYLNLADVDTFRTNLQASVFEQVVVDLKAKRRSFFEAIVADDAPLLHSILTDGEDVNLVAGPWIEDYFQEIWNTHCCYRRYVTPFFLPSNQVDHLRPTGLHLAILLNRQKALRVLLHHGIQIGGFVWFGEVHVVNGKLVLHDEVETRVTANVLSTRDFVDNVYRCDVHRVVLRMMDVRDSNFEWKQECRNIREALMNTLFPDLITRPPTTAGNLLANATEFQFSGAATSAAALPQVSMTAVAESLQRAAPPEIPTLALDSIQPAISNQSLPQAPSQDDLISLLSEEPSMHLPAEDGSIATAPDDNDDPDAEAGSPNPALGAGAGDEGSVSSLSVKSKKVRGRVDHFFPAREPQFTWREHVMVAKLIGPPRELERPKPLPPLEYLGKKSYWLESRKPLLQKQRAEEERLIQEEKERWDQLPEYQREYLLLQNKALYQFKSVHPPFYKPKPSLSERKEAFLQALRERQNAEAMQNPDRFDDGISLS